MHRCKLCEKESDLQNSHIIPRFIYKYMLNVTNNTLNQFDGKKNLWQQSNRQLKKKLFCSDCEQLLGNNEKLFSSIFKKINSSSDRNKFAYKELDPQTIRFFESKGYSKEEVESVLKGNPLHSEVSILEYFSISYIYRELLNNTYNIEANDMNLLKGFLLKKNKLSFMLHIRLHNSKPNFDLFSSVIVLDGLEDWKHFIFYLPNMQFHIAFHVNATPANIAKILILPSDFFNDDIKSIELIKHFQKGAKIAANLKT